MCVCVCVWRGREEKDDDSIALQSRKIDLKARNTPSSTYGFPIFALQKLSLFQTRCIESAAVIILIFRYCLLVHNTWHCPKL